MKTKNQLPQRLYYTLPDAAKELGCEVRDIIHYAAIQALQLSVYVDFHCGDPDTWFHLNIPSEKITDIDDFSMIRGDGWGIDFVEFKEKSDNFILDGYYAKAISGFFYVDGYSLINLEFNESADVSLVAVSTEPKYIEDDGIDINFQMNHLKLDRGFLCLRAKDLEIVNQKVSMPTKSHIKESNKTAAKKSELIYYLMKMIPELSDIDLEHEKITKITAMVEAVAAKKGVALPSTHWQTWSKYLER